jgi:CheY-like chemotaxis protein
MLSAVASNRLFLKRAMKRLLPKCEVFEAEDGFQAVNLVRENPTRFHVICLDKQMPVRAHH